MKLQLLSRPVTGCAACDVGVFLPASCSIVPSSGRLVSSVCCSRGQPLHLLLFRPYLGLVSTMHSQSVSRRGSLGHMQNLCKQRAKDPRLHDTPSRAPMLAKPWDSADVMCYGEDPDVLVSSLSGSATHLVAVELMILSCMLGPDIVRSRVAMDCSG